MSTYERIFAQYEVEPLALKAQQGAFERLRNNHRLYIALAVGIAVAIMGAAFSIVLDTQERIASDSFALETAVNIDAVHSQDSYRVVLAEQGTALAENAKTLSEAITAKDLESAQTAYLEVAAAYARLAPVATSFEILDDEVRGVSGSGGLAQIENSLFVENTVAGLGPAAADLVTNANALQRGLPSVNLDAVELARRTALSLETFSQPGSISTSNDLDAVTATLDGVRAAFENLSTVAGDDDLIADIDARLVDADIALADLSTSVDTSDGFNKPIEDATIATDALDYLAHGLATLPKTLAADDTVMAP